MKTLASSWSVAITCISLSLSACLDADETGNAGRQSETGNCPDPNAGNVRYASQDPAECAAIDFGCRSGETLFSDECGCGCVCDAPLGPCAFQMGSSGELIVPDSYKACQTDAECILVGTSCNHCCSRDAINADLETEFREAAMLVCADYTGGVCDCVSPELEPRCIANRCAASPL